VPDLAHGELGRVAGDDPVDQPGGVAPGDAVLEQRRDVDHAHPSRTALYSMSMESAKREAARYPYQSSQACCWFSGAARGWKAVPSVTIDPPGRSGGP